MYGSAGGSYVVYRRVGFLVEMEWNFSQETKDIWNAGRLPIGYRPRHGFIEPAVLTYSTGIISNNTAEVEVTPSGIVNFIVAAAVAGGRNIGHCVWIAA